MEDSNELYDLTYGNDSLSSGESDEVCYKTLLIIFIVCFCCFFIVGITGNGLVIWITTFKIKNISGVWLRNLAIADFICNIFFPLSVVEGILELYGESAWESFGILQDLNTTVLYLNMFTSVSFLTAISIDRCVSIMFPIWAKIHRTRKLVTNTVITIWVFSVILSVPHLAVNIIYGFEYFFRYGYPRGHNDTMKLKIKNSMYAIRALLMFLIPFIIILICYCLIIFKLKTIKRRSRSQRPFRIIIAIVTGFFICWFPHHISPFIPLTPKLSKFNMSFQMISYLLAYFNSCLNPILYVFLGKNFKGKFKKAILWNLKNTFNEKELDSATVNEDVSYV